MTHPPGFTPRGSTRVHSRSCACLLLLGISSCVLFFFESGCYREILRNSGFFLCDFILFYFPGNSFKHCVRNLFLTFLWGWNFYFLAFLESIGSAPLIISANLWDHLEFIWNHLESSRIIWNSGWNEPSALFGCILVWCLVSILEVSDLVVTRFCVVIVGALCGACPQRCQQPLFHLGVPHHSYLLFV